MLVLAVLHWGHDLLIRPVESIQKVKDMKNRLNLPEVDYVIFSSQYLAPIKLDNINAQLDDEILTELYEHSWKRAPLWAE